MCDVNAVALKSACELLSGVEVWQGAEDVPWICGSVCSRRHLYLTLTPVPPLPPPPPQAPPLPLPAGGLSQMHVPPLGTDTTSAPATVSISDSTAPADVRFPTSNVHIVDPSAETTTLLFKNNVENNAKNCQQHLRISLLSCKSLALCICRRGLFQAAPSLRCSCTT